jgi:hypothetical protein
MAYMLLLLLLLLMMMMMLMMMTTTMKMIMTIKMTKSPVTATMGIYEM